VENQFPSEHGEEIGSEPLQQEQNGSGEESFADLFEASLNDQSDDEPDQLVSGTVVGQDSESLLVDIGAKVEGAVPLSEFADDGKLKIPGTGDTVMVVVKSRGRGGLRLSMRDARQKEMWGLVETAVETGALLQGEIVAEIKGGYQVDLGGIRAFMPKSEADINPRHAAAALIGTESELAIITASRKQNNVVVSRRKPQQLLLDEKRRIFFGKASIGDHVNGVVKRLTDFGAFVEVEGVDALLHVSDISWRRLQHPDEALSIGQAVFAEIVKLDPENGKVSLSMRVLQADPWKKVASNYELSMRLTGTVRRLLEYGAMVELEPGVEGMIHRSQMSWTRKDIKPTAVLSEGDVVDVAVLEIDAEKRRIGLSLKAVTENPWQCWLADHAIGTKVTGKIRNITDFGVFVGLNDELDGLVHVGNISWDEAGQKLLGEYQKGQEITCIVLGGDIGRQRISLGIKQLTEDPFELFMKGAGRGARVHGSVISLNNGDAVVQISDGIEAFLPKREIPKEHEELKTGMQLEAKIIEVDRSRRRVKLSISQLLWDEEREAVRSYSDSLREEPAPSALALALQRKMASLPVSARPKATTARVVKARTAKLKAGTDSVAKTPATKTRKTKATASKQLPVKASQ